jgi:hypothetical protein
MIPPLIFILCRDLIFFTTRHLTGRSVNVGKATTGLHGNLMYVINGCLLKKKRFPNPNRFVRLALFPDMRLPHVGLWRELFSRVTSFNIW